MLSASTNPHASSLAARGGLHDSPCSTCRLQWQIAYRATLLHRSRRAANAENDGRKIQSTLSQLPAVTPSQQTRYADPTSSSYRMPVLPVQHPVTEAARRPAIYMTHTSGPLHTAAACSVETSSVQTSSVQTGRTVFGDVCSAHAARAIWQSASQDGPSRVWSGTLRCMHGASSRCSRARSNSSASHRSGDVPHDGPLPTTPERNRET